MTLVATMAALTLAVASPPAPSCSLVRSGHHLLLSNAHMEVAFDKATGAVVGLRNKHARPSIVQTRNPELFALSWSTWGVHGTKGDDIWAAADGARVTSAAQALASATYERTNTGGVLQLQYPQLKLGRKTLAVAVRVFVECRHDDPQTLWHIELDNRDDGVVREVQFPLFAGVAEAQRLLLPNHGGEQVLQPLQKLSDETPTIAIEYPARASMQWMAIAWPDSTLSLASHDEGMTYTQFGLGRLPGGQQAAAWMKKFPFAGTGSTWRSPPFAVGLHPGSWHAAADRYRQWLATWTQPPDVAPRVRNMLGGGGGLYIKDRTEKTVARYEDLVAKAAQVPKSVVDPSLMLIGWFRNGHDTYFPEYNAIDELGGAAALVGAINKVHAQGAFVTAYMNGRLNNIETETYKAFGKRWAVLGRAPGLGVGAINFFELHERWNPEWQRDQRGEGWFSVMCPSAKGWQDHIVNQAVHVVRDYKFDGIFLDQPGSYYAELCFNPHHGHSSPATAWGPGQVEIFKRIRSEARKANPNFAISTEGMNDVLGQYLDFHTDKNPVWEPMRVHPEAQTFPEMWRYTLPHYITSNGPGAFSYPPARDKIHGPNYRFVLGIRGIGRGFGKNVIASDEDRVQLDKVVSKLERLWEKAGPLLREGRFLDTVGLDVSTQAVFARAFVHGKQVAIPIWNVTSAPVSLSLSFDGTQVPEAQTALPHTARWLERTDAVASPVGKPRGKGKINVRLEANELDVLVLEFP